MEHNIFNVDENFFVITSDNLDAVKTKLYGFVVADNGIIENENINSLSELSGAGAYAYVKRENESIVIYRDVNGSYPLFLFEQGDWFALSNSFFLLVEYLKDKVDLDFNQDFANYMLAMDLVSEALEDTWVKQIKLLDKDAVVNIDVPNSKMSMSIKDWQINSIALDSKQGVEILDKWFMRWTRLLRNLQSKTNNILTDLSGGFDSRMTFCLALMSGMDLNGFRINSFTKFRHPSNAEDFEIASAIASNFGFELNKSFANMSGANFSIKDLFNMSLYSRMAFHRQTEWGWVAFKRKNKQYVISGDGGELLRNYWDVSVDEHLLEYEKSAGKMYSQNFLNHVSKSLRSISRKTINMLMDKYNLHDEKSVFLSKLLYMNTRSPQHFGSMSSLINLANIYRLQPLLDPDILRLNLVNDNCPDGAVFIATVFLRYCPKLLDFKFEGGRFIDEKTIDYAKYINRMFPVNMEILLSKEFDSEYDIIVQDKTVSDAKNDNEKLSDESMEDFLTKIYKSDSFYGFIEKYYDRSVWLWAKKYSETKKGFSLSYVYPLIFSSLILRLLESKKDSLDWLRTFQGRPVAFPREKFCCASIGIQSQDFDIIEISDSDVVLKSPKWFQVPSKGIMVESVALNLDLKIKSNADAKIDVYLRGADDWDVKTQANVPQWIDYTKFLCNGEIIFDDIKSVWFKKPFVFSVNVKKDEVVSLHFEWLPHREIRTEI